MKLAQLVFPGLVLIVLVPLPSASASVRTDVVDENYVNGFLQWNSGRGGISWGQPAASEDEVDPGNNTAGLFDEFVSTPLPRTIYLNATRVIQLDVFFKGTAAHVLNAEVWADKLFLTGGSALNTQLEYCDKEYTIAACADPSLRPAAPGFTVMSHRMQTELESIPKGAVIRLRLIHLDSNPHVYGLGADHGSVLRLPVFSSDEVLYRIPKFASQGPLKPPSQGPSLDSVTQFVNDLVDRVSALALVPLVGLGRRRRARGAMAVVAILGLGALAGCVGNKDPGTGSESPEGEVQGGSATSTIVPDLENETGIANSDKGSIFGVTVDDIDLVPVGGVFVALLGTPLSTKTDPYGRFHFIAVEAREYTIHFDRPGFFPLDTKVTVESGRLTRINAYLSFVNPEDRDHRPHRHDYWQGKDTIVLVDKPSRYAVLEAPAIIPPGTVDMEVVTTWKGGNVGVFYAKRPDDHLSYYYASNYNYTFMYPRPSGVPVHLRLTWELTDPGHALFTYWECCGLYGAPVPTCPDEDFEVPVDEPTCEDPDYNIKIILHKGVVPLEPAHPDPWAGGEALPLINSVQAPLEQDCIGAYANQFLGILPIPSPIPRSQPFSGCSPFDGRAYNATWRPPNFVPFETRWLEVKLHASRPMTGPTATNSWTFFYRAADIPPLITFFSCDPWGYDNADASRRAPPGTRDPQTGDWTWQVPVQSKETDPPYAPYTMWCFYAAPTDQTEAMIDDYANQGRLPALTLTVVAHKDPPPT